MCALGGMKWRLTTTKIKNSQQLQRLSNQLNRTWKRQMGRPGEIKLAWGKRRGQVAIDVQGGGTLGNFQNMKKRLAEGLGATVNNAPFARAKYYETPKPAVEPKPTAPLAPITGPGLGLDHKAIAAAEPKMMPSDIGVKREVAPIASQPTTMTSAPNLSTGAITQHRFAQVEAEPIVPPASVINPPAKAGSQPELPVLPNEPSVSELPASQPEVLASGNDQVSGQEMSAPEQAPPLP